MANINQYFDAAFSRFLLEERANVTGLASERNLCGQLSRILNEDRQASQLDEFIADPEYNRQNLNQIKTIIDDELNVITITSDIVFHRRGHAGLENNLMAIEMKKSDQPLEKRNDDRNRLRALTNQDVDSIQVLNGAPEHVRGYCLGVYLELDVKTLVFTIEKYSNGEWAETTNKTLPAAAG